MAPKALLLLFLLLAAGCAQPSPPADPAAPPPENAAPRRPLADDCDGAGPCPITLPVEGVFMDLAVDPRDLGHVVVALEVAETEQPTSGGNELRLRRPALAVTHDGGATWDSIALPAGDWQPTPPPGVSRDAETMEVVLGEDGMLTAMVEEWVGSGDSAILIHVSQDGGATWTREMQDKEPYEGRLYVAGTHPVAIVKYAIPAMAETLLVRTGEGLWHPVGVSASCVEYAEPVRLANGTLLGVCRNLDDRFVTFWIAGDGNTTAGSAWELFGDCSPTAAVAIDADHVGAVATCVRDDLNYDSVAAVASLRDGSIEVRPLPDLPGGIRGSFVPREGLLEAAHEPDGTLRVLARHYHSVPDGPVRLEEVRYGPGFELLGKRELAFGGQVQASLDLGRDGGWLGWGVQPIYLLYGYDTPSVGPIRLQRLAAA